MSSARLIRSTGFVSAVLACALFLSAYATADESPPPKGQTIVVAVGTFRNTDGAFVCRLFSTPAGFPEGTAGTVERRLPVRGGTGTCVFDNVSPGLHAISVMHDENGNRKLDKNFIGVPTEGYGASNNHTHAMSAPTWDESKFTVEPGKNMGISIALRY
jgi:uncharacterized protein (DUF2141 family)